ncbi:hypothetical protein FPV67DRAFT_1448736 [Lyophyllum atratum]|nr:hypothetical protein FPV67DRAFT_1448736 [Lyophyllum atratum]
MSAIDEFLNKFRDSKHKPWAAVVKNVGQVVDQTSGGLDSQVSALPPSLEEPKARGYVDHAAQGDSAEGKNGDGKNGDGKKGDGLTKGDGKKGDGKKGPKGPRATRRSP